MGRARHVCWRADGEREGFSVVGGETERETVCKACLKIERREEGWQWVVNQPITLHFKQVKNASRSRSSSKPTTTSHHQPLMFAVSRCKVRPPHLVTVMAQYGGDFFICVSPSLKLFLPFYHAAGAHKTSQIDRNSIQSATQSDIQI